MSAISVAIIHFLTTLVTFGVIRPRSKAFPRVLRAMHEVYDELHELMTMSGAVRAVILRTTNGGGVPRLGAPLYSSILYEAYRKPSRSIRKDWQNQQIDEQYSKMLTDICSGGTVEIIAENMSDGDLRTLYKSQGILGAFVGLISMEEKRLIYLSLEFAEKDDTEGVDIGRTEIENEGIRAGVNRLRAIFASNPGEL